MSLRLCLCLSVSLSVIISIFLLCRQKSQLVLTGLLQLQLRHRWALAMPTRCLLIFTVSYCCGGRCLTPTSRRGYLRKRTSPGQVEQDVKLMQHLSLTTLYRSNNVNLYSFPRLSRQVVLGLLLGGIRPTRPLPSGKDTEAAARPCCGIAPRAVWKISCHSPCPWPTTARRFSLVVGE